MFLLPNFSFHSLFLSICAIENDTKNRKFVHKIPDPTKPHASFLHHITIFPPILLKVKQHPAQVIQDPQLPVSYFPQTAKSN